MSQSDAVVARLHLPCELNRIDARQNRRSASQRAALARTMLLRLFISFVAAPAPRNAPTER